MTWQEEQARADRLKATAKAAIRRRSASLTEARDYYEDQATNLLLPKREREQWQALADELSARLGDRREDSGEQGGLF